MTFAHDLEVSRHLAALDTYGRGPRNTYFGPTEAPRLAHPAPRDVALMTARGVQLAPMSGESPLGRATRAATMLYRLLPDMSPEVARDLVARLVPEVTGPAVLTGRQAARGNAHDYRPTLPV